MQRALFTKISAIMMKFEIEVRVFACFNDMSSPVLLVFSSRTGLLVSSCYDK